MGGHPLVSDIWERSHFLWPRSDFLQARTQVSTIKVGIEVEEALTSSKGKPAGFLAPSWNCGSQSDMGGVNKLGLIP